MVEACANALQGAARALQLQAHRVADNLLDSADVALQGLTGLKLLAEGLIAGLEFGSVLNLRTRC